MVLGRFREISAAVQLSVHVVLDVEPAPAKEVWLDK